jgi:divalent metal cation (Fe/Co/Zn/Cd) transporter
VAVQAVIGLAEKYMRSADPRFPVGRTRLETVGVVACAVIMTIATIEVIQSAGGDLVSGFLHGASPLACSGGPLDAFSGCWNIYLA